AVPAELAPRSGDISQNDLDRLGSPAAAPWRLAVPPTVEPPVAQSIVNGMRAALPTTVTKAALAIEGSKGSFSILGERAVARADARTATVATAASPPPEAESEPLTASLRAFAANFLAEYRKDSASQQAATLVTAPAALSAAASPAAAPAAIAIEPKRSRQPE